MQIFRIYAGLSEEVTVSSRTRVISKIKAVMAEHLKQVIRKVRTR